MDDPIPTIKQMPCGTDESNAALNVENPTRGKEIKLERLFEQTHSCLQLHKTRGYWL